MRGSVRSISYRWRVFVLFGLLNEFQFDGLFSVYLIGNGKHEINYGVTCVMKQSLCVD
jgi:hypothetical protein